MDTEKLEKFKEDVKDKLTPFYILRDENFKKTIVDLLKKSNIKQKYIDILLDTESMKIYEDAFSFDYNFSIS